MSDGHDSCGALGVTPGLRELQCTRLLSMKCVSRKRARHVTQAKQVSKAPRHAQMQQGNR